MALSLYLNNYCSVIPIPPSTNPNFNSLQFLPPNQKIQFSSFNLIKNKTHRHHCRLKILNELQKASGKSTQQGDETDSVGVKAAVSMLRFYKREISPLLPNSCRYVPTCSEYSMIAYKKYGVFKGTVLTAWRLCRCNPLGGSGFDPPRWFDETSTLDQ